MSEVNERSRLDEAAQVAVKAAIRKWHAEDPDHKTEIWHDKYFRAAILAALPVLLGGLVRHDASIAGGCECCGTWVEHEADANGEWVKWSDLAALYAPSLGEGHD